jgi:site-specific recombinase XerD
MNQLKNNITFNSQNDNVWDAVSLGKWSQDVHEQFKLHLQANKGLSWYSVRNYLSDLVSFWKFLKFEDINDLNFVDRQVVRKYLSWLITDAPVSKKMSKQGDSLLNGGRGSNRGYASRSVVRKLSVLRVFFSFLTTKELVLHDPVSGINSPRPESRLPKFLDKQDVSRLLNTSEPLTPKAVRNRAILETLYAAGLRVSEMAGINVSDLDLLQGELRVLGKGLRERITFLGGPAKLALENYLNYGRPKFIINPWQKALFLNHRGGRLTQRSIQKIVKKTAVDAGLSIDVHTHTLRHTFATHLLDGGADLRVVQELLGHSSPATTEIYTHVTQASARKAYLGAHPRSSLSGRTPKNPDG